MRTRGTAAGSLDWDLASADDPAEDVAALATWHGWRALEHASTNPVLDRARVFAMTYRCKSFASQYSSPWPAEEHERAMRNAEPLAPVTCPLADGLPDTPISRSYSLRSLTLGSGGPVSGEADRTNDCRQQSHRSDDQPAGYEPDVTDAGAEDGHDESRNQSPDADRKAEHARLNTGQHACIQLSTSGVR